jgi:hypothetical protein
MDESKLCSVKRIVTLLADHNMDKTIYQFGFRAGLIASACTLAFVIVQVLQLLGVLSYPWDEILIYGFSLSIVLPFLLLMLALHYSVRAEKQFWSHAALIFTVLYAGFVTANYVVQLATVIPMTISGNASEIGILRQTPHSLFWDFDAIGYAFMGLATLFAIPVIERQGFQKRVRYALIAHTAVTPLILFVYFSPGFSEKLLVLALPWGITAPLAMLALAVMLRKGPAYQN